PRRSARRSMWFRSRCTLSIYPWYPDHSPFLFTDSATTEIYTLSLHDALPICIVVVWVLLGDSLQHACGFLVIQTIHGGANCAVRSEEHTSELQSQSNLVCRLLLEKKKSLAGGGHPLSYRSIGDRGRPREARDL